MGITASCTSSGGDTLVSGPGAGGGGILEVTPPEPMLSAGLVGGPFFPLSSTYQLLNSGSDPLDWSASSISTGILFLPESGMLIPGQSIDVTIYLNTEFVEVLPAGSYSITADFKNETSESGGLNIPVNLSIAEDGELDVSPTVGFSSTGNVGGPFSPTFEQYSLHNTGIAALDWEADASASWTVLSSNGGTLQPDETTTITVAIDENVANALSNGVYLSLISVAKVGAAGEGLELLVNLHAEAPASMTVVPFDGMSFAGTPEGPFSPSNKTYVLSNTGDQDMPWSASSTQGFMNLTPSAGTLPPGQSVSVVAAPDIGATSGLSDGTHNDQVQFANAAGDNIGSTTRDVVFTLTSQEGELNVTPGSSLSSFGPVGGPFAPNAMNYTVANIGDADLNWNADANQNWIFVSPSSGTIEAGASTQVLVSIDSSIAGSMGAGGYNGTVAFIPNVGSTSTRPVSLTITQDSTPGDGTPLVEGSGFTGPTSEPGPIGSGPASDFHAVAQADVVPWQEFTGEFEVGVLAFHHREIDRVEFSANGGAWVAVDEPTLNPRTGVVEYWVKLDAGQAGVAQERDIEVRAIAYPNAGRPRLLGIGPLRARPNGTTGTTHYVSPSGNDSSGNGSAQSPYKTIAKAARVLAGLHGGDPNGCTIKLMAGDYIFNAPSWPTITNHGGWLTIEPAPGVDRNDAVIIDGVNMGIRVTNVKLNRLTVRDQLYTTDQPTYVWFNECNHIGNGQEVHLNVGWTAGVAKVFWTDGLLSECRYGPQWGFVRGMTIWNIGEICFNGSNPILNTTVDNIDRGSQTSWHPDLVKTQSSLDNVIFWGLRGTNIKGQGLFWKYSFAPYRKNFAIVNTLIEGIDVYKCQVDCRLDHLIMRNCTIMQTFLWLANDQGHHAIQGNIFKKMAVGTSTDPSGYGSSTSSSIQQNGIFDNNHYITTVNSVTPGSNVTTGAINFMDESGDNYRPISGQGLRRGALWTEVDIDGNTRSTPATIGAYEE